jgi:hypothetical protein
MADESHFDQMSAEELAKPHNPYIDFDDSTWNGLKVNPDFDTATYGNLPDSAPPEYVEDGSGVPKYIWGGKDGNDQWIVDPSYQEPS